MNCEKVVGKEIDKEEEYDDFYILDNQYVFILLPSGNIKVVKLQKDTKVSLGKFGTFHANDIIGKPFGHSYEIHDRDKIKVIRNVAFYEVDETDANNKETIDDPSKQKLSYADIEQLKKDGLEGQDIIKKVIESHSTFDKKTEYSKAKYIKRKESKFSRVFTPVKPTLYSVWEYFYAKNPSKIRDMRIDTLSQMLTLANVRAYGKMLVVDDTQGLVISGVMERLGGYGVVIGIHDGENHNFDVTRYMNFSKKVSDSLMVLSWQQVFKEKAQAPFNYRDESSLSEKDLKFYLRSKANYERIRATRELLFKGGFDGYINGSHSIIDSQSVSTGIDPGDSGALSVRIKINYNISYQQRGVCKMEAYGTGRGNGNLLKYLNPTITEGWLRQYQVLPGRTHPSMSASGGGGYLLQATYVVIDPSLPTPIPSHMRAKVNNDPPEEVHAPGSSATENTSLDDDNGQTMIASESVYKDVNEDIVNDDGDEIQSKRSKLE
ncbi:5290_t:CDS:10 [Acaulospora colombiana]|uniref:5290_t:CDS:1 n=1 Tax=Acaulospora colombiana TaxID=27376 RepID=A0ACA9KFN5_9GLOM|nr:5290_t:CDS:10 [Acaulospora colombiana]